tara:strand:+ start:31076 stop:31666 length:591 start_codon:yes stop_codon:yes gene_type:complete
MINFKNLNKSVPYNQFVIFYNKAIEKKQRNIEACAISSYDKKNNFVDSRFVNIKYIIDDSWIFFSNYNSPKSSQFESHNQISALFFWSTINVQIRLQGEITKTSKEFSDEHFNNRSHSKNALAKSSKQSKEITSYEKVIDQYEEVLKTSFSRPNSWGGFEFIPFSIEFWQGNENRLNKRELYSYENKNWNLSILQP